ncbi:MAG: hypothetical protein IPM00_04235 [Tetrasphaera sp.]|nr:hypothetical protein [Tetrasphaera sp.]
MTLHEAWFWSTSRLEAASAAGCVASTGSAAAAGNATEAGKTEVSSAHAHGAGDAVGASSGAIGASSGAIGASSGRHRCVVGPCLGLRNCVDDDWRPNDVVPRLDQWDRGFVDRRRGLDDGGEVPARDHAGRGRNRGNR